MINWFSLNIVVGMFVKYKKRDSQVKVNANMINELKSNNNLESTNGQKR